MLLSEGVLQTAKELVRQVHAGRVNSRLLPLQILKLERATVVSLLRADYSSSKASSSPKPSAAYLSALDAGPCGIIIVAMRAVRELQHFLEHHLDAAHIVEAITARVIDALETIKNRDDRGVGSSGGRGTGMAANASGNGNMNNGNGNGIGNGNDTGDSSKLSSQNNNAPLSEDMLHMGFGHAHAVALCLDSLVERMCASSDDLVEQACISCVTPGDHVIVIPSPLFPTSDADYVGDDIADGKTENITTAKGQQDKQQKGKGKGKGNPKDSVLMKDGTPLGGVNDILEQVLIESAQRMRCDDTDSTSTPIPFSPPLRVSVVQLNPDDNGAAAAMVRRLEASKIAARVTQDRHCTRDMQALHNAFGAVTKVLLRTEVLDLEHGVVCTAGSGMLVSMANRLRVPVIAVTSKMAMLPVGSGCAARIGARMKFPGRVWAYDEACDASARDAIAVMAPVYDVIGLAKIDVVVTESGGYDPDYMVNLVPTLENGHGVGEVELHQHQKHGQQQEQQQHEQQQQQQLMQSQSGQLQLRQGGEDEDDDGEEDEEEADGQEVMREIEEAANKMRQDMAMIEEEEARAEAEAVAERLPLDGNGG